MEILRREYSVNIRIISISRKIAFLMKDILNRDPFSDHADRALERLLEREDIAGTIGDHDSIDRLGRRN